MDYFLDYEQDDVHDSLSDAINLWLLVRAVAHYKTYNESVGDFVDRGSAIPFYDRLEKCVAILT